jgi:hypothetical protein
MALLMHLTLRLAERRRAEFQSRRAALKARDLPAATTSVRLRFRQARRTSSAITGSTSGLDGDI